MIKIFYDFNIHAKQIENPNEKKWEKEGRYLSLDGIIIVPRGESVPDRKRYLACRSDEFELDLPAPKLSSSKSKPIECVTLIKDHVYQKVPRYILCIPADMLTPKQDKVKVAYSGITTIQTWEGLDDIWLTTRSTNEAQDELEQLCKELGPKMRNAHCPQVWPINLPEIINYLENMAAYLEKFREFEKRIEVTTEVE